MDKNRLLMRAEQQFLNKNYDSALKIYSLLLSDYPQLKDAKVGAYLSDMGLDSDEDAQALYTYYQIIKDSSDDPEELIDELMQSIYATRVVIQEALIEPLEEQIADDGIFYNDFLQFVKDKGSFKEAFEDIMFSTRIVIRNREEFIDFISSLIKNEYYDMALSYLDNLGDSFGFDQEIMKLYENIPNEKKK